MNKTHIDPEEYAYPSGTLIHSRRYAYAICSDGIIRKVKVALPDTWFSIPGRVTINHKTVSGYVVYENAGDRELHFVARGKNSGILLSN